MFASELSRVLITPHYERTARLSWSGWLQTFIRLSTNDVHGTNESNDQLIIRWEPFTRNWHLLSFLLRASKFAAYRTDTQTNKRVGYVMRAIST